MSEVTIAAVYMFCAHYHSGQWSRGYRLLCRADKVWKRKTGMEARLSYWESLLAYNHDSPVTIKYNHFANLLESGELSNV